MLRIPEEIYFFNLYTIVYLKNSNKQFIKNMNKQKVVVITSYPSKELIHDSYLGGVASYAKNTLLALKRIKTSTALDLTVIADKVNQHTDYVEGNIRVKRIWKKYSILTFPKILKDILTHHRSTKTVIVEFEHQMFGNIPYLLPFPLFLLILKLLRKRTILVCHQVIPNMEEIGPHINISSHSLSAQLVNFSLGFFYKVLLFASNKVIVFEANLKSRLSQYGSKRKIVVIAHGVQKFQSSPTKKSSRQILKIKQDKFVILLFGFLGWYKGTDWAIDAIKKIKSNKKGKNIELIIAGGSNPNLEEKEHYLKYIQTIQNACETENIRLTGFVDEKEIPLYYSASDLVILPYRAFMSASGPLSLAFSFKKPFLVSPKLKAIFNTKDMQTQIKRSKIREEDMHFTDFNGDFSKKINRIEKNKILRKRLSTFVGEIQKIRSWDVIGNQYYSEIVN